MSAPAQVHLQGPQDEPMDIDPAPTHSPPSSSSAPRGLPLPGRFVNGAHEVVHHEMKPLQDLCKTFGLPKTGNMATLTERLTNFSADRKAWDGLLPGARNKHRGPRVGGVTKSKKKKGTTKLSTLRRHAHRCRDSGFDGVGRPTRCTQFAIWPDSPPLQTVTTWCDRLWCDQLRCDGRWCNGHNGTCQWSYRERARLARECSNGTARLRLTDTRRSCLHRSVRRPTWLSKFDSYRRNSRS
ncbi:hypothetical protein EI94DRAFT_154811 [Lactarius quietus]|nr:hypothetical protein EI94DRAFT_154811 [Lactarius quietus]